MVVVLERRYLLWHFYRIVSSGISFGNGKIRRRNHCAGCPYQEQCCPKIYKKAASIITSKKMHLTGQKPAIHAE